MKHRINIRGVIVPNEYRFFYRCFDMDCTCPNDVQSVLDKVTAEDEIEVYINSPGGVIDVGSEIYTLLRGASVPVKIYVTGEACSAASIIAMAAHCEMSPTALMMVHCVSCSVRGNHNAMEHMAEELRTADEALCTAYMAKANMTKEDALAMMEHETWLTAEQALQRGLIDAVMFQEEDKRPSLVAGPYFTLPTEEQLAHARKMMGEEVPNKSNNDLLKIKLSILEKRGEMV